MTLFWSFEVGVSVTSDIALLFLISSHIDYSLKPSASLPTWRHVCVTCYLLQSLINDCQQISTSCTLSGRDNEGLDSSIKPLVDQGFRGFNRRCDVTAEPFMAQYWRMKQCEIRKRKVYRKNTLHASHEIHQLETSLLLLKYVWRMVLENNITCSAISNLGRMG